MEELERKIYYITMATLITVGVLSFFYIETSPSPYRPWDYKEIRKDGTIRFVTDFSMPGYFIDGDSTVGFQHELIVAVCQRAGLNYQTVVETHLSECFRYLELKAVDVVARNVPITSDLRAHYLFTDPIMLNRQVLVQRTAEANNGIAPIRNQIELGGKTVYIPKESPAIMRMYHLQEEIGDTIRVYEDPLYSDEQLIIMVAHGDIDFAVCEYEVAEAMMRALPQIDIATDITFTQFQAWAVRRDSPALLDSLNSWFAAMRADGTFDRIYNRYYHPEKLAMPTR